MLNLGDVVVYSNMKKFFLILLSIASLHLTAEAFIFNGDNVEFDEYELNSIDLWGSAIYKYHDNNYKKLAAQVRGEIEKLKTAEIYDLQVNTLEILKGYLQGTEDLDKSYQAVRRWSEFHGDDRTTIMWETLLDYIHKKDFELSVKVAESMLVYRESQPPEIEFSPNGQGKISWYWNLKTNRRKFGKIHVGLDLKKRTFVCYESDVGLYFPEGEIMERIYSEIVQVPEMANQWLGKGRKEKLNQLKKVEGKTSSEGLHGE